MYKKVLIVYYIMHLYYSVRNTQHILHYLLLGQEIFNNRQTIFCIIENEEMVWLQVQKACDGIMG